MAVQRPRILTPKYEPPDSIEVVTGLSTAPGRPVKAEEIVEPTSSMDDSQHQGVDTNPNHLPDKPRRFLPPPIASDPALLSSQGYRRDITFNDQVEQLELEVETVKEARRSIPGLDTEDLNAMLRAFDKQVQHVRLCPPPHATRIPPGLDLHPDPEEELSVHKVRSALERLYASAGMGMYRVLRELQRIRSWEDGPRSTIALGVYSYAWYCDLIITMLLLLLSALVLFPSSRRLFFESAARNTGSGVGGDAVESKVKERTESEWGPAATEASATRWAESVQDVVQSMSTGKTAEEEKTAKSNVKEQVEEKADKELEVMKSAGQADPKDDSRNRRELVTRMYAQPSMRVLAGLADKWERMDHALQPKGVARPTDRRWAVFIQLLFPLIVLSVVVSERFITRVSGFLVGVLLFGQPLVSHVIAELDRTIPDWKSKLVLELNLFGTVPTNAQLVLDLLREAERRKGPLPPAPNPDTPLAREEQDESGDEDDDESDDVDGEAKDMRRDIVSDLSHVKERGKRSTRANVRKAWDKLGKTKEDGFAVLAGHRKIDVHGTAERVLDKLHISTDHRLVAAALDHMPSKGHGRRLRETSSSFYVWHKRHGPGHVIIHPHDVPTGTSARIEFSTIRRVRAEENVPIDPRREPSKGHLIIPIDDIIGLRKLGMGTIKSTALSWALDSERAGGTGLEVTLLRRHLLESGDNVAGTALELDEEEKITLTSIVRRDELFNRLIALGSQRWEMV